MLLAHLRRSSRLLLSALALAVMVSGAVLAEVRLPSTIGDNMVLQQGVKVPIWGWADAGEQVTVTLSSRKSTTVADDAGEWRVEIGPLEAGGPLEMTVTGENTLRASNVLVGEVWLCSGQSNMWWPVSYAADADEEIAQAVYPNMRLFTVARKVAAQPLDDVEGEWSECSPETAKDFAAVAYYFGRALHKELNVPVGLIHSSCPATAVEVWTSRETLESDPDYRSILDRWNANPIPYGEELAKYRRDIEEWESASEKAKAEGTPVPRKPNHVFPRRPTGLYNSMLRPLAPYAIRGVIWYQGESNAGRARQYRKLFPAMIEDWRRIWDRPGLPFLFVQLCNYRATQPEPSESRWAELREAQLETLLLPGTGMAVTIDIGDADNIHPSNKQEVGRRLSLVALGTVYDRDIVYSGPAYDSMSVDGAKVRLRFRHVGGGLMARGGKPLKGFAIAGPDGEFVWGQAEIDGDEVVVWSDEVRSPVTVRYAWADNPVCNLCNREGLPASPFRTGE